MAVSILYLSITFMQITYHGNLFAPPGPLWAGPLWAPWAGPLWAPLGSCGLGPCGLQWAIVGRALVGLPGPLWAPLGPCGLGSCGRALVGLHGPLWALLGPCGPSWALVGPLGSHVLGSNGPFWDTYIYIYLYVFVPNLGLGGMSLFSTVPD